MCEMITLLNKNVADSTSVKNLENLLMIHQILLLSNIGMDFMTKISIS